MRPNLTKEMDVELFNDFYWLKEELQAFCREHGINTSGSKVELSSRITIFLQTGEIQKPIRKSKTNNRTAPQDNLTLDTIIVVAKT